MGASMPTTDLEHATGSVQGICSGAIGLLALLIAFIGYTAFNSRGVNIPWSNGDLIHLGLALLAAIALALVPWIATSPQPRTPVGRSVEWARALFLFGACCTIASMAVFMARDFLANHQ